MNTLEGLLDVSIEGIDNVIHSVTYVRPNGIVGNIGKQGECIFI